MEINNRLLILGAVIVYHAKFFLVVFLIRHFRLFKAQEKFIVDQMSQSWHAHWAEDGFKPKRLGNWQVPRWHAQWPDRHCTTTNFQAHKNGRLFNSVKRSANPWSNFKGTWELPLKIDRKTAEELSKDTEYKKAFWKSHNEKNRRICQAICNGNNKKASNEKVDNKQAVPVKSEIDKSNSDNTQKAPLEKSNGHDHVSREKCKIKEACLL